MLRTSRPAASSLLPLLLLGCTGGPKVGPDYEPPKAETQVPQKLEATGSPVASAAGIVAGAPVNSDWWVTFGDPQLTALITSAVSSNLDLQMAESRVREARAARGITAGAFAPQVGVGTTRGKVQGQTGDANYGYTTPSFEASWEIDVFGGLRRTLEAAEADLAAMEEGRRALLVSLLGEVGRNYCELRGTQRQLAVARQNVALQGTFVQLIDARRQTGLASDLDYSQAATQLELTRATLPRLESDAQKSIYRLSVLLGGEPDALNALLGPPAALPPVPPTIPVGLPSELLQRRPDIRVAEREMAAACARVGVATADLYPKFGLTASLSMDNLWVGPTVSWPLFTGGQIVNNIKVADERLAQALLRYRSTILLALEDVEGSITAFSQELVRRTTLFQAVAEAQRAVDAAQIQFDQGLIDQLPVIVAQQQKFTADRLLAQSEQTLLVNLVAVYKALGGGWEHAEPPPPPAGQDEEKD